MPGNVRCLVQSPPGRNSPDLERVTTALPWHSTRGVPAGPPPLPAPSHLTLPSPDAHACTDPGPSLFQEPLPGPGSGHWHLLWLVLRAVASVTCPGWCHSLWQVSCAVAIVVLPVQPLPRSRSTSWSSSAHGVSPTRRGVSIPATGSALTTGLLSPSVSRPGR